MSAPQHRAQRRGLGTLVLVGSVVLTAALLAVVSFQGWQALVALWDWAVTTNKGSAPEPFTWLSPQDPVAEPACPLWAGRARRQRRWAAPESVYTPWWAPPERACPW